MADNRLQVAAPVVFTTYNLLSATCYTKALKPVIERPTINELISFVPS